MALPLDVLERINQICTRFEQAWRNDSPPDLANYLTGTGAERRALFRELLQVELEYRRKNGERPDADEYGRRFPDEDGASVAEEILLEQREWDKESQRLETPISPLEGIPPRYRAEQVLGQGAFGVVYRALDQELNRFVALKVAHPTRGMRGAPDAFLAEARTLASLDHPGIIPVYDVGQVGGRSYIVTKLIEGQTLAERLRQGLPDRRQAARWLCTAAHALQAAHDKGLVHRDVKPSNLFIDGAGNGYLGDFGLALSPDRFGQGPQLLGTPAYMSPEQARGEGHRVDARSDVFSLGVVLYELLTGRPPFQAPSLSETLQQISTLDPVLPVRLNPSVGRDLDTICMKCLEKRPERRYATAQALAEDLQRFLEDRPIRARRAGPVEQLVRWCRRNPTLATALTAMGVAFVTAFVAVSWSYLRVEAAYKEEARQRQETQRREKEERWQRYRANLVAAASTLQADNVPAAREALENAPTEHRSWEWQLFRHQVDTADQVLFGPANSPLFLSADGGRAVFASSGGAPFLLDIAARKEAGPLASELDGKVMALSADGQFLAGLGTDNTILVWDIAADHPRTILRGLDHQVRTLRFSPDGARLAASVDDGTIRVWDIASGKELHVLHGHLAPPRLLTFRSDGRRLASAGGKDRTIRLWDMDSGRPLAVLAGHDSEVSLITFNPQGDRLVSSADYPSTDLRLWDAATGKLMAVLRGHGNEVLALIFSPDGSRIASGGYDQTIRLWDGQTGKSLFTLDGHRGWVTSLAFSPDGRRLVSASHDQTLRLWGVSRGEPLAVLHGPTSACLQARYTNDGATVVGSAADGSVRLWNAQRMEYGGVLKGHTRGIYGVAFHPDGQRVASAAWDATVRLWDAAKGQPLSVLRHPDGVIVVGVDFHPGGKLLASVGREDCVRLWNADTGREVGRFSVPNGRTEACVAFSRRGDLLACVGRDRAVHLWRIGPELAAANGAEAGNEVAVLQGHHDLLMALAFSRDDEWLASAASDEDPTVRIWDLGRRETTHVLQGHTGAVHALAVSPNGRWLASGSNDATVRLWDTTTWQAVEVLKQGTAVYGVAFNPDGTRLACACANGTIRLWDVATRQSVCDLHGHSAYVHSVAFSPDGTRLVSGSGDRTVRIWDSLPNPQRATGKR